MINLIIFEIFIGVIVYFLILGITLIKEERNLKKYMIECQNLIQNSKINTTSTITFTDGEFLELIES